MNKNGQGSLTLGGYDSTRFIPSNTTFDFAPDTTRDLVVAIRTIVTTGGSNSLLSTPILSFIDSAVSHIWLPLQACQLFEETFLLDYDDDLGLYLVNDTVHSSLIQRNATISFTLSNDLGPLSDDSSLVTIEVPYAAFDLQLTPEYPNNKQNATYYFPIRRAANDSQYTLGRTFLQQAYLIADYERKEFSLHQALFPGAGAQQDLKAIVPLTTNGTSDTPPTPITPSPNGSLLTGHIAGITVAATIAFAILLTLAAIVWRRYRGRHRHKGSQVFTLTAEKSPREVPELLSKQGYVSELHARSAPTPELPSSQRPCVKRPETTEYEITANVGSLPYQFREKLN